MITDSPPPTPQPLRRRSLFGLLPLAATALALAPAVGPAHAEATAPAPECLADLLTD